MKQIHQGANQIYEVVENLNKYMSSRLSQDVSMARLSVHQLVDKKAMVFYLAAKEQHTSIENRTDPALFIRQNESLFSVILHNLIDNAVKNTKNGAVQIGNTEQEGVVVLYVNDTGKGMTPAQLSLFNDYFKQYQPATHHPGIGFGFMIIKEIATLLRLEIRLENLPEGGVSIRVSIPQAGL